MKAGEHKTVACLVCGQAYRQSRSDQMYCSRSCAHRMFREKRRTIVKCRVCKETFLSWRNKCYCSNECSVRAESRRKQLKNNGRGKNWSKGSCIVPRTTCSVCGIKFYAPPVLKRRGGGKYCSNKCKGEYMATNPEIFPQTQTRRGKGGKRKDLNNIYFRSAWEANYARYLNWLIKNRQIVSWEFEPDHFEFTNIKKGTRFYVPDFKIKNNNGSIEYHEVKGYMDERSRVKLNRMAKYYPSVKLILIDKSTYYSIARSVAGMLPNWEYRR